MNFTLDGIMAKLQEGWELQGLNNGMKTLKYSSGLKLEYNNTKSFNVTQGNKTFTYIPLVLLNYKEHRHIVVSKITQPQETTYKKLIFAMNPMAVTDHDAIKALVIYSVAKIKLGKENIEMMTYEQLRNKVIEDDTYVISLGNPGWYDQKLYNKNISTSTVRRSVNHFTILSSILTSMGLTDNIDKSAISDRLLSYFNGVYMSFPAADKDAFSTKQFLVDTLSNIHAYRLLTDKEFEFARDVASAYFINGVEKLSGMENYTKTYKILSEIIKESAKVDVRPATYLFVKSLTKFIGKHTDNKIGSFAIFYADDYYVNTGQRGDGGWTIMSGVLSRDVVEAIMKVNNFQGIIIADKKNYVSHDAYIRTSAKNEIATELLALAKQYDLNVSKVNIPNAVNIRYVEL